MLDLLVAVLNFNTPKLTVKCLESIFRQKGKVKFEVLVIDNASSDESVSYIRKHFPQVKIYINSNNLGFAGGNNIALKKCNSRYILLLNSDTKILENTLDNLVKFMDDSGFDIGSCMVYGKDGLLQPNVGDLPFGVPLLVWLSGLDDILFTSNIFLPSFHQTRQSYYKGDREVGWVSGSIMLIKPEVVKKIGYLDEQIFMYGEDVDYCIRANNAGFKVGWTDKAKIVHLGGGSSQEPSFAQWLGEFKSLLYIYRKYRGLFGAIVLKILIYFFVLARISTFFILGKTQTSKIYVKVLTQL